MLNYTQRIRIVVSCLVLAAISTCAVAQTATIIYVRKGAAASGDGTTWAKAYPELQQALNASVSISGNKQIWVANGEYRPSETGDRTKSFELRSQTFIYGGFAGNESSLSARNWRKNRTVLTGELGALFDKSDNSFHVVVAKNVDSTAGLDGFIISEGNANGSSYENSGGGMLILSTTSLTSPLVNNCEFVSNSASSYGGGLANISDGNPVRSRITNCFFHSNQALIGGAIANYGLSGENSPEIYNSSFSLNRATSYGGAIGNNACTAKIVNGTFNRNQADGQGGAIFNTDESAQGKSATIKNSILWKNFTGTNEAANNYNQIYDNSINPTVKDNIIHGGYGSSADNNRDTDPRFLREASFVGKYPRTSIIPVAKTLPKYEKIIPFFGSRMPGSNTYYTYMDHQFNKLYMIGSRIQVIDYSVLNNNLPTSTIYSNTDLNWGRTQRIEESIHQESNKIYLGSKYSGLVSINRASGVVVSENPMLGESETYDIVKAQDVVIDDVNNLLYSPIFLYPGNRFYGLLEWNLSNQTKRWINTTSSPVSMPLVETATDDPGYWGGHKLFLDEEENILYYAMGKGVWWWNRSSNSTGVFTTEGGIPGLKPGNPNLPSNFTTHMFMDHTENKFYIGTHSGLFVWDRTNHTSRVYNTTNSKLVHNLINIMDKNEEENLLYVACEEGGMLILNTKTGEEKILVQDSGYEVHPQLVDTPTASAHYDEVDKKLYVSADHYNGGVLVMDYNHLLPDYGDLNLNAGSPAIDYADSSALPADVIFDINGFDRRVDFAAIRGVHRLDLGAYEKAFECAQASADINFQQSSRTYSFHSSFNTPGDACQVSYSWTFGDGSTSGEVSPQHEYISSGTYVVRLKLAYECDNCSSSELLVEKQVTVADDLCLNIICHDDGGISIGTQEMASGYTFSIKGKAIMSGATVSLADAWPDYVFDDTYKLTPLPELKTFIDKNGHLPNIPSAATVERDGIDVGRMSALMLEKTEELTLYLIQLDQRLRQLESKSTSSKK